MWSGIEISMDVSPLSMPWIYQFRTSKLVFLNAKPIYYVTSLLEAAIKFSQDPVTVR